MQPQARARGQAHLKLASLTKGANRLRSPLHGLWHVKSFRVQEVRETHCLAHEWRGERAMGREPCMARARAVGRAKL